MEATQYNIVLAASSFHWINPEIVYQKAADALRNKKGFLVLRWNKEPTPSLDVWQSLAEVYEQYGLTALGRFESESTPRRTLNALTQRAVESGFFRKIASRQVKVEVAYTAAEYVLLSSSYSH